MLNCRTDDKHITTNKHSMYSEHCRLHITHIGFYRLRMIHPPDRPSSNRLCTLFALQRWTLIFWLCVGFHWMWQRAKERENNIVHGFCTKQNSIERKSTWRTGSFFCSNSLSIRLAREKEEEEGKKTIWNMIGNQCVVLMRLLLLQRLNTGRKIPRRSCNAHSLARSFAHISIQFEIWNWKIRSIQENNTLL